MLNKNITATDILNYHYCPRIIYYVHVLKIPQATTVKEYKGREKYTLFKNKSKRNKIIAEFPHLPRKYDIYLEWEGLATKADCVLFDGDEAIPVQMKYAKKPRKTYKTTYNQLLFEGLLIEKALERKVIRGFVKYELSSDIVHVALKNIEQIWSTIESIKNIAHSELMPKSTSHRKRCVDCCYKKLCWG